MKRRVDRMEIFDLGFLVDGYLVWLDALVVVWGCTTGHAARRLHTLESW